MGHPACRIVGKLVEEWGEGIEISATHDAETLTQHPALPWRAPGQRRWAVLRGRWPEDRPGGHLAQLTPLSFIW